ncbi:uncharacterized protein LJ264_013972 [Porphyrio hochstetteri]
MAERKQSGRQGEEEEVPAFFKNLGSGSPKPRQKFCGMFCPVEGSLENKTIDFDSLSVGRGSNKVVAKQKDVAHLGPDAQSVYSRQSGKGGEPSVDCWRKVEIRSATGKEALQNLNDKVCICAQTGGQKRKGAPAPPNTLPVPALPSYLVTETDFSPGARVAKCPTQLVNAAHGAETRLLAKSIREPPPPGIKSLPASPRGNSCPLLPGEDGPQ